jgi:hypothetical protein
MCDIAARARYLIDHVLTELVVDRRMRLPKPAPGSDLSKAAVMEVIEQISGRIEHTTISGARICTTDNKITLTTAWCCERWCSTYRLLQFVNSHSDKAKATSTSCRIGEVFVWPSSIPDPATQHDVLVTQANQVYPNVVLAAVLHEVGHAVNVGRSSSMREMELTCDRFASKYLLGAREDPLSDALRFGLAIWFCCLCTEGLNAGGWSIRSHPNPVQRMQNFLREFVQTESEINTMVWQLCVGHVMVLARTHNRPALDDFILPEGNYQSLDTMLDDLKSCW